MKRKEHSLYFLPLGGSGEIGMNLNLYCYQNRWLMVDCGISFYDKVGLEIIMPKIDFLKDKLDRLEGILLTHGHEDHIGALPYLWEHLGKPKLYATPFTKKLIERKFADTHQVIKPFLKTITQDQSTSIGPFNIEMVSLTHSIPEPNGILIRTPAGNVFHTGDWKIDHDPLIGKPLNDKHLSEIGDSEILAMVSDSTNVFDEGDSGSEATVRENLLHLIDSHKQGAIFVTCFASNVARVQTIALAAEKSGRKAVLLGRGLREIHKISEQFNYFQNIAGFIDPKKAASLPRKKLLYVCSGSQGEDRAALKRLASQSHPDAEMLEGDTVIFSSRVIPGNEKSISHLKNKITRLGVAVVSKHHKDIHVSGHPGRKDLLQMYQWIKPKVLIPVHGELIHMVEQAKLAKKNGIPHVVIPENGLLIELCKKEPKIIEEVISGRLAVDGNQLVPLEGDFLKARSIANSQGIVSISVLLNDQGFLYMDPEVKTAGLSLPHGFQKDLVEQAAGALELLSPAQRKKKANIETALRKNFLRFLSGALRKKPLLFTHVSYLD